MAEPTSAAAPAVLLPDQELLSRAESFTREPFLLPGEDPAEALAPGSAKRRALDDALAEIEAGAEHPSTEWRRNYSLMLGLERVLSEDEARLADGTQLNPHQVDALSGTLTALLAEAQSGKAAVGGSSNGAGGNGAAAPATAPKAQPEAAPAAAVTTPSKPATAPVAQSDAEDEDEDEDDEFDEDFDEDEDDDEQEVVDEDVGDDEEPLDYDAAAESEDQADEAPEDPNAHKRFWFEHATGAGKTVAAMGFVEASRTGGILILTHRRNLVDQFNGELKERGYGHRVCPPLMKGKDQANGPVTVETYQWFVRNAGSISSAYTVVICDEAHTALGEKTAGAIRQWTGPIFIGMTATGALIARHVTDLFPTQTSRFDLAQAARRGVISPLRSVRIPPGPGVRTIAKVPLRRGEVDTEFDQEMLAELLDQLPFNLAAANLYKTRFNGMPGVVYAAGVRHAYNLAEAFREEGIKAMGVSGETPKRELAEILARYERGDIDVLINAQLLAEGWNSPRATVCFHLAPTASKRIYQQRVGRVTRRHPGKEAGLVVDFVHPGTKHDDPVVTLHSLLDRDVYRGGAIVVGPVRRGRGRRVRVERRVLPVASDENRRIEVFERELWRIAVEHLDWGEQIQWAALAGARVAPSGWRRARAMLHFDRSGELKRTFLLTAVQRNKNPQLRVRALQEIAASRDAEAFDLALDEIVGWPRDEKREAAKAMLQALAEKRIGRRDQADAWIWRVAAFTAELHEEYAVQRWPETKRLLGLLANSSGGGHARNARRLVHAARKQDRRLAAALLAAATRYTHTPEAEEVLRGARTRMARKPSSLSRELLRNFPKGRRGRGRRRKKKGAGGDVDAVEAVQGAAAAVMAARARGRRGSRDELAAGESEEFERELGSEGEEEAREGDEAVGAEHDEDGFAQSDAGGDTPPKRRRRRRRKSAAARQAEAEAGGDAAQSEVVAESGEARADGEPEADAAPKPRRSRRRKMAEGEPVVAEAAAEAEPAETPAEKPKPRRSRAKAAATPDDAIPEASQDGDAAPTPKPRRSRAKAAATPDDATAEVSQDGDAAPTPKPRRSRAKAAATPDDATAEAAQDGDAAPTPKPRRSRAKAAATPDDATPEASQDAEAAPTPKPRRSRAKKADAPDDSNPADEAPKPRRSRAKKADDAGPSEQAVADELPTPPRPRRRTAASSPEVDAVAGELRAADEDAPAPRRRTRRTAGSGESKSDAA